MDGLEAISVFFNYSKAEAETTVVRCMRVSQSAAGAVRAEVPTAAPDHAFGLSVVVPVACPFPDVAMHVEKAPGVGCKGTHGDRTVVRIETCVFRGESFAQTVCRGRSG